MWDQNGNRLHASMSPDDTRAYRVALEASLSAVIDELAPLAEDVRVELAAVRASRPGDDAWLDWVAWTTDALLDAAESFPDEPDGDDGRVDEMVAQLGAATAAVAARWRGDPQAPPPKERPPVPQPEGPDEVALLLAAHADLLERARPHSRVDHLPFDPGLRDAVAAGTAVAAHMPPTLDFLTMGLGTTASLANAVAANADAHLRRALADEDQLRRPLCAAVALLDDARRRAHKAGDEPAAEHFRALVVSLLDAQDWSVDETWAGNEANGETLFYGYARAAGDAHVREQLGNALDATPERLNKLLLCCAQWIQTFNQATGTTIRRRVYYEIQPWLPVDQIRAAATQTMPGVAAVPDRYDERYADGPERLLGQVLGAADAVPDPAG